MAEPEELIIEGAYVATRAARDVWRRYGRQSTVPGVPLSSVRARLELFATALVGAPIAIAALEPPAAPTWLSRLAAGRSRTRPPLCATDGTRVYLPVRLDHPEGNEHALQLYRVLTIQQALRLSRGSRDAFAAIRSSRAGEWFMLAEAAVVDRVVALSVPGLAATLQELRAAALAERTASVPRPAIDTALERDVSALLAAAPDEGVLDLPADASPRVCRAWAADRAALDGPSRRHPFALPAYWGAFLDPAAVPAAPLRASAASPEDGFTQRPRVSELRRRPRIREAAEDEDDSGSGTWVIRADEPQESVEDPFGLQRPADRQADADPDGLADSLAELPEARVVRTPETPREVLRGADAPRSVETEVAVLPGAHAGIAYPEWDYRRSEYRVPGAIVRLRDAPAGDAAWVSSTLARHATLVQRVRRRFERLRPRSMRLYRQADGDEVDVAAWVTGDADRRAGVTMDGRLYVAARQARHELAVAILLDVSASTDAWVSTGARIVDVEKEAMLIVSEALDALGDRYALFAFSGEGPEGVSLWTLKSFAEPAGSRVSRRIGALDADRYTRLGAPIRHVTAALCRERAARRLLLVLSDGKPNDEDLYEGRYGVEDTRRAVAEARRQGVSVFCLTVDREAPRYVGRIFGGYGFAVLRKPAQLPAVVVDVLRQLVRG
jgi:nitric oxide reductase NorD protein